MSYLLPAISTDRLYPSNAVYAARTDLFQTRMLGYNPLNLDTATAVLMGVLNGRATIRHEAGAGPEILHLFTRAGIKVQEDLHLYRTEAEARACADRLIETGHRLFGPYPFPDNWYPDEAQLVDPELYRRLNAKQNLSQLVSHENMANQEMMSQKMLDNYRFSHPICLKAAGDAATGWGYAVFPCLDASGLDAAKAWFRERQSDIADVIAEEWLEVDRCWCAGIVIEENETHCFGGAEQVFSAPGKQSGSIVDSEIRFPSECVELAIKTGEVARRLGFRGVAGLDIGRTVDGRTVLFDPNFRFAASTSQLLFHPAAAARSGMAVSHSFQVRPPGRFDCLAEKLHGPIDEGWFVPTRIFNGEKHPSSNGENLVTGFVLAEDREEVLKVWQKLRKLLLD